MLIVEIFKGHHEVSPRVVGKEDSRRTIYEQKAYMHDPAKPFPTEFVIGHDEPVKQYPIGKYTLDAQSFKVNQYNGLELDRYNIKLLPIQNSKSVMEKHF